MVRVNLPNYFHIVVLHASVNFPSKQIFLKISIPSIFDELLACFVVPNFCHRFHGGSMCIIRNWFDGKFMMLHDAAAIFKKSLGRETGFFSNCAIHFMYLLCYDLPFAPVFYIQCFAFRRGNVWLMGNFNVP